MCCTNPELKGRGSVRKLILGSSLNEFSACGNRTDIQGTGSAMWQVGTAVELAEAPGCDWQGLSCGSWEHQEAAMVSVWLAGRWSCPWQGGI